MAENKTEEEILETDTVNEEASSAEEETKEAGNEASAGETEAKEAEEKADKKAEKKEKTPGFPAICENSTGADRTGVSRTGILFFWRLCKKNQ